MIDTVLELKKLVEEQAQVSEAMRLVNFRLLNLLSKSSDDIVFKDEFDQMSKTIGVTGLQLKDNIKGFKIHIPDFFPKSKELINKSLCYLWTAYVHEGIRQIESNGHKIKNFERVKIIIDIHLNMPYWDIDNRAFNIIINALKGTLYTDDTWNRVSLSLYGKEDDNVFMDLYILDEYDVNSYVNLISLFR